jgi:hypothetical protein
MVRLKLTPPSSFRNHVVWQEGPSSIRRHLLSQRAEDSIFLFVFSLFFFFLDSRKPHSQESVFCGSRWASKTSAVSGSYKRCTPWLELETCCADLKFFTITLCPLGTCFHCWLLNRTNSRLKIWYKKFY